MPPVSTTIRSKPPIRSPKKSEDRLLDRTFLAAMLEFDVIRKCADHLRSYITVIVMMQLESDVDVYEGG